MLLVCLIPLAAPSFVLFNKLWISRSAMGVAFATTLLNLRFRSFFFITFRNVFSMFGIPLFGITGLAFAVLRVKPLFLVFGCIITSPAIETFTSKPICCLRGLGPKVRCQRLNFAALTASLAFAFLETPLAYVGMLLWLHVRRRLGPSALRASSSICFVPPPFMMDFLARFADSADLGKLGERLLVSAATTNFRVFP